MTYILLKLKEMNMKNQSNGKFRIIITFTVLFLVVSVLLLLIFYEGKKSYVVTFDLDGGTLLSGSLEQVVTHGQDATPPTVVKDGAYLHSWSAPYRRITKDTVIKAVWEYETTPGIIYTDSENQNYTEVAGAFKDLYGEVYLGAHYNEKKVISILDYAFANCNRITKIYLLDGLITLGDYAFAGCSALTEIEIPETVIRIGEGAFNGCKSLETLVLNEGLLEIGANAFEGCTNLKEVILPESLEKIDPNAFAGCDGLIIKTKIPESEKPEEWKEGWSGNAEIDWGAAMEEPELTIPEEWRR